MKLLNPLLVAVYVALAALPAITSVLGWRGRVIEGSLPPTPAPALTFEGILGEKVQHGITSWFESHLGLKGTSIALDNAILYHGFSETKYGATIRLGKDGVLFGNEDIDYYNKHGRWLTEPAYVEWLADEIADAQRRLAAKHRAFVPVIIPAKTSIYRDKIPDAWIMDTGVPRPADETTRMVRAALDRRGVVYVDARKLFETSEHPRAMLYGADARHWSPFGACLALREVTKAYVTLTGKPRPPHECNFWDRRAGRNHVDYDLLRLLNSYFVYPHTRRVPSVRHAPPPAGPRPSMLFVGSSFCWTLIFDAEASGVFGPLHMSYYHRTFVPIPENTERQEVKAGTPMWNEAMVDKDIYVLDLFESYLASRGAYPEVFLQDFKPVL
jgi:hypothetical protein